LALALLLVGVVSATFLRHVVQILPIVLVVGVLARRPAWGAYAAIPIFLFWTFIVVLIWLFLLGLSRVANGHYTPIEVVSTFLMAGFSVVGLVGVFSSDALWEPSEGSSHSLCSLPCSLRPCGSASSGQSRTDELSFGTKRPV